MSGPCREFREVGHELTGVAHNDIPAAIVAHVPSSLRAKAGENGTLWGTGFAWAANRTPELVRYPVAAGTLFGLIVFVVMRLVTMLASIAPPPTLSGTFVELVAHTVFFGVPLALVVRARLGAR